MTRCLFLLTAWLYLLTSGTGAERLSEAWHAAYAGDDAKGAHVLGYWRFEPGAELEDSSGRGHRLALSGAVASAAGKFGGALESFPGGPGNDKRHAATMPSAPVLSPKGAFSAEMWIKPKPELAAMHSPVLLDKKYVAHTDYQLRLSTADKGGARRLQVSLGFGDASETMHSEPFTLTAEWQHVAFTYDGAGELRFFRNGAPLGSVRRPGRGPIAPGRHLLSIGDRVGSTYAGFPGFIDEVRLCDGALEFRPVSVEFRAGRTTLLRMEKSAPIPVVVRNLSKAPAKPMRLRISSEGANAIDATIPPLAPGATHEVPYAFDTALRPDTYRITARLEMTGEPPFVSEESTGITLAPRPLARMPVVMWGIYGTENVREEMARLKDLGFTHCLGGFGPDYGAMWAEKKALPIDADRAADTGRMLDSALAHDLGIAIPLSPGHWLKERPDLQRVNRDGQPYRSRPDVNAALPGLADFCFNAGASVARAYDRFPAWQAVLINTETRDSSQISFSEIDRAAYRKSSGREIPAEVAIKSGVEWQKLKEFPADRVVPDDHPILEFYRWWWTVGDGWNALHTAVHRGVHSTGRDEVWTWFDPAIRAASIGGSGGAVDVLGQWTYTNPDPLRIGYFTDEMFAMAANSPQHPRVMKMTQLFWYRTQSAPKTAGANAIASPFDDHDPDAAYITISPMHLRESFWTKLARPVSGIMYHGWQALVPTESTGAYRYTHPDTQGEFRRLHREVLAPLGPALLRIGERRSDVAYLDSFTAQMFARRGSYGYSSDEAYRMLLHAQLQPEVIYEAQLARDGLDRFKVLVLSDCDVLPASVVRRIRDWQQRGGLVIGDENVAPAITPDIRIAKLTRTRKADADKAAVLAAAARLRTALDTRYTRAVESSEPEIVPRLRHSGESDYVFVVNDRREFGTYVGQHGMVMENGLPSSGDLTLARAAGHVYDLVASREVPATASDARLRWPVNLGPCDGRVFLVTPRPIEAVRLSAPREAALGKSASVNVTIVDRDGKPVPATIPMQIEFIDPAGRRAEWSGAHAVVDGTLALTIDVAKNDAPGVWTLRARELASGREAVMFLRVVPSPAG